MITITDKIVTTRKEHKCFGCCENIPAGEKARYIVNPVDGKLQASYWCLDCDNFVAPLEHWQTEDGFYEGEIADRKMGTQ